MGTIKLITALNTQVLKKTTKKPATNTGLEMVRLTKADCVTNTSTP